MHLGRLRFSLRCLTAAAVLLPTVELQGQAPAAGNQPSPAAQAPAAAAVQAAAGGESPSVETFEERNRLWNAGIKLRTEGKFAEAIEAGRKMLAIERKILPAGHYDLIFSLTWLAETAEGLADWPAAEEYRAEALELAKAGFPAEHWYIIDAECGIKLTGLRRKLTPAQNQALVAAERTVRDMSFLQKEGKNAEAEVKFNEVYELRRDTLGATGLTSDALAWRAVCRQMQGKHESALADYEEVLAIRRKWYGERHPQIAVAIQMIGGFYYSRADYAKAVKSYVATAKLMSELHGETHLEVTTAQQNVGLAFEGSGNYGAALPYYEAALKTCLSLRGEKSTETATFLNLAGYASLMVGRLVEARQRLEKSLAIRLELLGEANVDTAVSLNNLGLLHRAIGDYATALGLLERALTVRAQLSGEESQAALTCMSNIALVYSESGNYPEARRWNERTLALRKKVLGEKHPDTVFSQHNLGMTLLSSGDYSGALHYLRRAAELRKELHGEMHPEYATSTSAVGVALASMGDFTTAKPYYERALEIRKQLFGERHPEYLIALNNMGWLLNSLGDYPGARRCYEETLAVRKEVLGVRHPDYAYSLNNMAAILSAMGDNAAARPYYEEAVSIRKEVLGPKHPDYAFSLNNLGSLLSTLGDYPAALKCYQESLQIRKEVLGEKHPDYASSLDTVGSILSAMGEDEAARPFHESALAIRREVLGERHPDFASSLCFVAGLHERLGNLDEAVGYYAQACDIIKQVYGENHPYYATTLGSLAILYTKLGRFAEAEKLLIEALEIPRRAFGESHPEYGIALNNLGWFYQKTGNVELAESNYRKSLTITRAMMESCSLAQSERQQLSLGQSLRYRLNNYVSLGLNSNRFAREVFDEVLAWKGATLVRQRGMRLAADDPAVAELFGRLQQTARQMASLSRAVPEDAGQQASWRRRVADLTAESERLEAQLSDRSAAFRHANEEVTLDNLLAVMPDDAVLVDFLEFSRTLPSENPTDVALFERQLVAFVVRHAADPADRVKMIGLGSSIDVGAEIDVWRTTFGVSAQGIEAGLKLRKMLWEPIEKAVTEQRGATKDEPKTKNQERSSLAILISTDGVLGRLPIGALPGSSPDKYLLEEFRLAMIPVPQLLPALLRGDGRGRATHELLLMGDVDYDGGAGDAEKPIKRRRPLRPGETPRSPTESGLFDPLANTAGEIASIKALYAGLFEVSPDDPYSLVKQQADEGRFRELAPQYRHLHLATHGFFAGATFQSTDASGAAAEAALRQSMVPTQLGIGGTTQPVIGIGVRMEVKDGAVVSTEVVPGGAAAEDGRIKAGDVVLKVGQASGDMVDVRGMTLTEVVNLIRGAAGTKVRIEVRPAVGGDPVVYEMARKLILQPGSTRGTEAGVPTDGIVVGHNPGLLSGLALAGANRVPAADVDDGILTAQEIGVMNLSGVDTVVLSACDTGLGETAGGEGLLGVQRAFQVAGARTTVASFWKVDDLVTRLLMERFYRNLWEREMSRLDALREAQIYVLNHPEALRGSDPQPDDPRFRTSPKFWAAFTLSGDWR